MCEKFLSISVNFQSVHPVQWTIEQQRMKSKTRKITLALRRLDLLSEAKLVYVLRGDQTPDLLIIWFWSKESL